MPSPMNGLARPIATVSRKGAHRWVVGHPWIYRSDVVVRPDAPAGTVEVRDERGKPLGIALWSPASEISLRLIERTVATPIDSAWWRARIETAARRRTSVRETTTAYRVVHGEGDGLPSLVVDRYDEYLVVQLMSAGVDAHAAEIIAALRELFEPRGILARNDAALRSKEGLPRETVTL